MFQLIYLRVHAAAGRPAALSACRPRRRRRCWPTRRASPEFAFARGARSVAEPESPPRAAASRPRIVDEWNLDKSLAFYKDRFADASDFTFVFVGSFDLATMKPLVERYLGALPSTRRKETWKDVGVRHADGRHREDGRERHRAQEPGRDRVHRPVRYDQTQRVAIRAMAHVLQNRLRETIREELGGTYSISAQPDYTQDPAAGVHHSRSTSAAIRTHRRLSSACSRRSSSSRPTGPTEKQVNDEKEGPAARIRDQQQAEQLPADPDRRSSTSTARIRPRSGDPGVLQEARRRDDPAGGADVPQPEELGESDAVSGKEVAGSIWRMGRPCLPNDVGERKTAKRDSCRRLGGECHAAGARCQSIEHRRIPSLLQGDVVNGNHVVPAGRHADEHPGKVSDKPRCLLPLLPVDWKDDGDIVSRGLTVVPADDEVKARAVVGDHNPHVVVALPGFEDDGPPPSDSCRRPSPP